MSNLSKYKIKFVTSILNTIGAIMMRKSQGDKEELSSEEVNEKVNQVINSYTDDILEEEPYSPIKFGRWILKSATCYTDADGFVAWQMSSGDIVDTVELYERYKTSIGE